VALYNAEIDRIRAGEGYYAAAAAELRPRGYPTRSVFNWRTPLPMWLIGRLPSNAWGQTLLGSLCLAVLLLSYEWLARETTTKRAVGCSLLLLGALLPCLLRGGLFAMPELWSGTLIALSIAAYALQRRKLGLAAGIAALFFRELAAPYCLVALLLAARERRWRESLAWLVGLAAYAAYYAQHAATVLAMLGPDEVSHPQGWVRFGGAAFVLSTVQMNAWLLILPQWVAALYFALAMLGLAGWKSAAAQRLGLTICLYVAAFGIVGQPFNQYWGCMFAPLLCFGAAAAPVAWGELWKAAELRSVWLDVRPARRAGVPTASPLSRPSPPPL
jgi:hypothetical protein